MKKTLLVAPGPTQVPEPARLAMARELIHHRGPQFAEIFGEVREGLRWVFQTEQDVLQLTCSGTGAFEAGLINFTSRADTVIAIGGGKFGERWGQVAEAYGMTVVDVPVEWGRIVDLERLADVLDAHPDAAMVTVSASETSTGVLHPVREIAELVHERSEALVAVDGITAVGVHPMPMDEWGIDVLVSGSQKAFSVPPGLGFLAASERAWERQPTSDHPKFYFDLRRERAAQKNNQTAYTPAITLVLALQEVLRMMREEGLEAMFRRHEINATASRAGVLALGLRLLAEVPSHATTAAVLPDGVSAPAVFKRMRDVYGVTIAGGQDQLKPNVLRIGHLGYIERGDIVSALSALELSLQDVGHPVALGAAVAAAQMVYAAS